MSIRETSRRTSVSKTTVAKIGKEKLPDRNIQLKGRNKKITKSTIDFMVYQVTKGKVQSATALSKILFDDLGILLSTRSIRRYLKSRGIVPFKKQNKPKISAVNRKLRLEFGKSHVDWTDNDWKNVIWSDETKINRFGSDGVNWCYKRSDEGIRPEQVNQTVKLGGGSVMVWSCITWEGVGYLVFIDTTMDKHLYKNILEEDLIETINYYGFNKEDILFMHDNDRKHTAKIVTDWLKEQKIETLNWPAQSPDLNPIENIWALLKKRLYSNYSTPPSSIKELKKRIVDIWYSITPEEVKPYMLSMHKRCNEVIKAKGYWTKH
jgi:transposase